MKKAKTNFEFLQIRDRTLIFVFKTYYFAI